MRTQQILFLTFLVQAAVLALYSLAATDPVKFGLAAVTFAILAHVYKEG
jgi:hypothetical protein